MEFVRRAATRFASRPAVATIVVDGGESSSSAWVDYGSIVRRAERLSTALPLPPASSAPAPIPIATPAGNSAIVGPRVAIWGLPGPEFVASLYACYLSGAAAVPLSPQQPAPSLSHCLEASGAAALLAPERLLSSSSDAAALLKDLASRHRIPLVAVEDVEATAGAGAAARSSNGLDGNSQQQEQQGERRRNDHPDPRAALIVYTSGSTGRPKGVVHSAASLLSQADGLARAWRVSTSDRVVHSLPLHHVHGLVNALHSPLGSGARVRFLLPRFSARAAWAAMAAEAEEDEAMTAAVSSSSQQHRRNLVFHGVPTIYSMLLEELGKGRRKEGEGEEGAASTAAAERGLAAARKHARLFVCGSAACPPSLWRRWKEETGHALLERYGMTEAGMILSNPFAAEDLRRRGSEEAGVVEALAPPPPGDEPSQSAAAADAHIRRPGSVGLPLPGVDVRLVPVASSGDDSNSGGNTPAKPLTLAEALALEEEQAATAAGKPDDSEAFYALRVRGPALFSGYWRRDDATREAFASSGGGGEGGGQEGFFDTGDVVAFDRGGGDGDGGGAGSSVRYLRVVGRASADVIKPRGFKVSGLDVEAALLQLSSREGGGSGSGQGGGNDDNGASSSSPLVSECAVFGVPDARFEGEELVAALVRLSPEAAIGEEGTAADGDAEAAAASLSRALAARLPPYALPRVWLLLPPSRAIPRNAMGKVNKKALRAALFKGGAQAGARWVDAAELKGGS